MYKDNYHIFVLEKYICWLQDFIIDNHNYSDSSELFIEFWKDESLRKK